MPTDKYGKPIQLYDIVLHYRDFQHNPLLLLVTGTTDLGNLKALVYDGQDNLTEDTVILRHTKHRTTVLSFNVVSWPALRGRSWYRDIYDAE